MTTNPVASEFVPLCRQGQFDEVMERLLSPDIVRVEPVGMGVMPARDTCLRSPRIGTSELI